MNDLIDAYNKEILCTYEGETYSVRDNGAILRHSKEGSRKRRNDNIWTLGIVNKENGYLLHSGVRVHRIVATAFLGETPTKEHVVDHINTNKQDNRPENLRWVTKLENIILNPITCKKIMWMTGKTIDYVLQHIEILHDLNLSPDIQWMRTVTAQESKNCYENLLHWAKEDSVPPTEKRGVIGEWIYQRRFFAECNKDNHLIYTLTDNAVHDKNRMKLPSEYPCCPAGEHLHNLEEYLENLKQNALFFKTDYAESLVEEATIYNDTLIVRTRAANPEAIKKFHVMTIRLVNNTFVHELYKSCFQEDSSQKYFTILQDKEWTGGPVFDDYC